MELLRGQRSPTLVRWSLGSEEQELGRDGNVLDHCSYHDLLFVPASVVDARPVTVGIFVISAILITVILLVLQPPRHVTYD